MSATQTPTANTSTSNASDIDVGAAGKRRRGGRFVRFPDGEIRLVDRDFDCSVFEDPESEPAGEMLTPKHQAAAESNTTVEEVTEAEKLQQLARTMLDLSPGSLIAIYHDRSENILGVTFTGARRGPTVATFRAALRGLPACAKQVTLAFRGEIAEDVREAAKQAAEILLIEVRDIVVLTSSEG